MKKVGVVYFSDGCYEPVLFYSDQREDLIEFKTQFAEYVMDKETNMYYRRVLSEDYYGDPVHDYIPVSNIERLCLER